MLETPTQKASELFCVHLLVKTLCEQCNASQFIMADVDRIKKRYEVVRELDYKIFDTNMIILDAKRRANDILEEVRSLEVNIGELKRRKNEEMAQINHLAKRHSNTAHKVDLRLSEPIAE